MTRSILIAIGLLLQATTFLRAQEVKVAAAISMKEALTHCAAVFEQESKTHVKFSVGGSGELAAQIEQGAPIDLFISAAQDQIDQLDRAKVVDGGSRVIVARKRLVLIAPPTSSMNSFDDLKTAKTIAIGQPKTVPAGKYAMQVLNQLQGMGKQRLIYGTNVRQVLDYVERGEVSAGMVYQTDAMLSGNKVRVVDTAKESWHDPIVYPAVVVNKSANATAAGEFLKFLQSEAGQKILADKGFLPAAR